MGKITRHDQLPTDMKVICPVISKKPRLADLFLTEWNVDVMVYNMNFSLCFLFFLFFAQPYVKVSHA